MKVKDGACRPGLTSWQSIWQGAELNVPYDYRSEAPHKNAFCVVPHPPIAGRAGGEKKWRTQRRGRRSAEAQRHAREARGEGEREALSGEEARVQRGEGASDDGDQHRSRIVLDKDE